MNQLRILHIVTYMGYGGLETMLMNYYRHIDRNIIQFDFLVHRFEKAAYDSEIESLGGRIYRLPILNPFSVNYRKALKSFFNEHNEYKIIHVHQDCMSSLILKEAKNHDIQVRIAHSHTANQNKNFKYPIKLFYKNQIKKYATKLFACGYDAGKWMFKTNNFEVFKNAIDVKKYTFNIRKRKTEREKMNINDDEFVVGHVGMFRAEKNHARLLEIYAMIVKQQKSKLILIGDGDLHDSIVEKIHELNLQNSVIMLGTQINVSDLMQAMDVFILPSKYEGLGIVGIEAQASGLQCFFSDKVPIETKITNLVKYISLDESNEYWAKCILDTKDSNRPDTSTIIQNAGYDIDIQAKLLQSFYLKEVNMNE